MILLFAEMVPEVKDILDQTLLVGDLMGEEKPLPRRFRILEKCCSGSAQFSKKQYFNMKKKWPVGKKVIVVDLRQECHFFLANQPVAFFNLYFTYNIGRSNIEDIEKQIALYYYPSHYYKFIDKEKMHIQYSPIAKKTSLEREVEVIDVDYKRFPVTDRCFAEPAVIDEFLMWIRQLPEDVWLHFHCRGGKGRTTTFMMMYDIWKTKAVLPFAEYLERQTLIGGTDLSFIKRKNEYLESSSLKRFEMLQKFYDYVRGEEKGCWSEFIDCRN